jgi:hypothetical protein
LERVTFGNCHWINSLLLDEDTQIPEFPTLERKYKTHDYHYFIGDLRFGRLSDSRIAASFSHGRYFGVSCGANNKTNHHSNTVK